ncbi:MAG: hypothetical protein VX992_06385 [Acidobacteriota bacterium]|nr:hypothetical protein [Acidobacteriota bacterium]
MTAGWTFITRVSAAAILVVALLAVPQRVVTQELPLAPMRASGQSVTAAYEGWFRTPDGQIHLLVGYFNRNTEEVLDIPVGSDNRIEPGGPDYGQPTHFLPRRAWGVFSINVPPDFFGQTLTWTIVANGQLTQVPMGLDPLWEVEPYLEPAQGNTPPQVKFISSGEFHHGPPLGISAEYEAAVDDSLTLTLWATDDGQVDPNRRVLEGAPVRVRWSKYRGEGEAVFSEPRPETDEATGETSTTVTFSAPGVYILRAQLNDSSGASGGFQCCWTNAHVQVDVSP